jgi:hypothetical protein
MTMSFMSPLDLLMVSSHEQDIIRCLVRRPGLGLQEIAGFTKIPLKELETLLGTMVQESRLTRDGESKFQVSFGDKKRQKTDRGGAGLLDTLFP